MFTAFCCLCAVHCMQAAAASFVSPKAVLVACKIGSRTAKNSAQSALEVDIFRSKVKKIFWVGDTALSPDPSPMGRGKPLPTPHPSRRLRRLDTRACGARPWPPVCKSWIRHCLNAYQVYTLRVRVKSYTNWRPGSLNERRHLTEALKA